MDSKVTTKDEAEAQIKAEVAEITNHSKSDLDAYVGVDSDYMNYSSVARKPFKATESSEGEEETNEEPKAPEAPEAPKAPGAPKAPEAPGTTNK